MRRLTRTPRRLALAVLVAVTGLAAATSGQVNYDDLAPDVAFTCPAVTGSLSAWAISPSFAVRFEGTAPASPGGRPVKYRYLFRPAIGPDGVNITSGYQYFQVPIDSLVAWGSAGWSPWLAYPATGGPIELQFPGAELNAYYLVALQVMDHTGAVSLGRGYQYQVGNFVVRSSVAATVVTVSDPYLGASSASGRSVDIAAGQPLNLFWTATADAYCGRIISLRHGWDLIDVNDPYDPGWEVAAGLAPANYRAPMRAFNAGLHTFSLRVVDDQGGVRVVVWYFRVIPFVDPAFQLPLLVLDQVWDSNSSIWPSRDNRPLNDQVYRNAWWHFLAEGYGGVADLNWTRDWRNHTATVTYEDLVGYRAVLCYAKASMNQAFFANFRPSGAVDKYVWLAPYQQQGGNFMLVGDSSQDSFLEIANNYMVPVIFEANETTMVIGGSTYRTGFGTTVLPDGSTVLRGPRMYPYATAGIAALDWTAPASKYVYGRTTPASNDRSALCGGLKGLVLAPEFRARHLVPAGAIADTTFTEPEIDWRDAAADVVDTLSLFDQAAFVFRDDEFVNGNIGGRPTPFTPRACDGPEYVGAPDGQCIEPMFTGIARLDWMRERQRDRGRVDWPQSRYSETELENGCGPVALTDYEGQPQAGARTNGQVFGYLSYASVPQKPGGRADVYWGFDPYRFDHARMKDAVRWALEYFGLTINR